MKNRFQKHFTCLLICILLLTCTAASAEVTTWQLKEEGTSIYYDITKFDTELPDVFAGLMAKTRWADWKCIKGIRQDERKKKTDSLEAGVSLVVVQKDGQTMLLQFLCMDGRTWECVPAAEENALFSGRNYEFNVVFDRGFPHVEIVYPSEDGGREVFRLCLPRGIQKLATLEHYCREYADGSALTIGGRAYSDSFFYVETKSASGKVMAVEDVPYFYPVWLEALDANRYPKTLDEVRSYIAANPQPLIAGYGIFLGSNMRKKTSTQSNKLGVYHTGTLAKILGTKPGKKNPWYQVQVGQTVGYISEPYLCTAENERARLFSNALPLTVGRVSNGCELKLTASSKAKAVATLTAGTVMYVLADCGDWLHVCIPRGELGYMMDIEGTYGYLRTSDVTQAATPLQLKYTGD